jgi:protein gp37
MTKIEWVKSPDGSQGITLNSKTGCRNHTPEGLCLGGLFPCYCDKLAHGRLKRRYQANYHLALLDRTLAPQTIANAYLDPFYPRWWPERLKEPSHIKKPTGIFLDDMSDWMADCWPLEWTMAELRMMRRSPQHRFYTLTKQPRNLPQFSPFPDNCWVGVTATKWVTFSEALGYLATVKAKVKFLSFEPLLERIRLDMLQAMLFPRTIDWLIIGGCTGTKKDMEELCKRYPGLTLMPWGKVWTAQPRVEEVQEIARVGTKANIPIFLKDNLRPLLAPGELHRMPFYDVVSYWSQDKTHKLHENRLRQELPKVQ